MSFNFFKKNLPPPAPQKIRYLRCEGFKVPCLGLHIGFTSDYSTGKRVCVKGQMLLDDTEWLPFSLPIYPTNPFSWSPTPKHDADKAYTYRDTETGEEGIELPAWTMHELVEWLLQQKELAAQSQKTQAHQEFARYVRDRVIIGVDLAKGSK